MGSQNQVLLANVMITVRPLVWIRVPCLLFFLIDLLLLDSAFFVTTTIVSSIGASTEVPLQRELGKQ